MDRIVRRSGRSSTAAPGAGQPDRPGPARRRAAGLLALLDDGDTADGALPAAPVRPRPRRRARSAAFQRRAELRLTRRGVRSPAADIALYDEAGDAGRRAARLLGSPGSICGDRARSIYLRIDLVPAPLRPLPPPAVLDRLGEILPRVAAAQRREPVAR